MHDSHTAARDQVSNSIFSEGIVRQPAENGDPAQHYVLQPGHRTPATSSQKYIPFKITEHRISLPIFTWNTYVERNMHVYVFSFNLLVHVQCKRKEYIMM